MVYRIEYSTWKNSLEIGEEVINETGERIKVLSIIKLDSYEGDTFVYVLGAKSIEID